ncbi:MAG: glycosyl transferase [Spirochaetales bacterium]|nr:glycosyl transferase [Spirochaetales bacterium]
MNYGHFDNEKREYVITNPGTPVKWINYIGTLSFGGFVDQTGCMLLCKGDPAFNRITKYIQQLPSSDFKGSTLYLRIKESNGYRIFSPFYVPTLDPYDSYVCHVGLGYSRIVSEFYGIKTDTTIFVPLGRQRVIWDIRITNSTLSSLSLDAIPVLEYSHPQALKQFNNADWVPQTMQSKVYNNRDGMKILTQYAFSYKGQFENYITSNYPVSSFESDRKTFLGKNEYGSWAKPLSLLNEDLVNREARRGDNIGALLHKLGVLAPGETKRIIIQIGQAKEIEKELPLIEKYRREEEIDAAFRELHDFWNKILLKMQVTTVDISLNSILNIFNPYQCYTTFNWSRSLSLYQLGLGARGTGFRDSSQDVLGIMDRLPGEATGLIKKLFMVQKTDGSAMHQFYPLTMEATAGDSSESEDRPKYYGDDHLWIVLSVAEYLKETGNFAFLDEIIPYYNKDKFGKVSETGTVLDHLERSIEFTHGNVGKHGLPLLGFADWNDAMNLKPGAESLFVANLYGKALLELIDLYNYLGNNTKVKKYSYYYDEMKKIFNTCAWDGEWFIRYFDYDGTSLGSKHCTAGKIYTNGQSWPVISRFAPEDKGRIALDSVYKYLNTLKGIKLSTPGYDKYDLNIGGMSSYPPGAKENGGIFIHTNPWAIIAETILGNGDRAYEYYSQINPAKKNDIIDEFECEPYVYPQNILGDEHPQFGLGRNSWLSGTATWMYVAGIKYILGIRAYYNGLIIDPCIPSKWDTFAATRIFRGSEYRIEIQNPYHICKGIKTMTVDGKEIEGNCIPVFKDEKTHTVLGIMG